MVKLYIPPKGIINRDVRLFCIKKNNILYCPTLEVWRIMLNTNRIMIRGRICAAREQFNFIDGSESLHFSHRLCKNPSEYIEDDVIIKLNNLSLFRSWLMNVTVNDSNDMEFVNLNAEYKFTDYWIADE